MVRGVQRHRGEHNVWTPYNGDGCQVGLCGYANAELESYSPKNLSIVNFPFEPGTRALAIQARREVAGSSQFTSGKLDSYNKVQVQYGMIEVRLAAPDVQTGLWPAAWLLGTTAQAWPTNIALYTATRSLVRPSQR